MVLWCGRSCKENVWSDIASWRTKQPSNCTKLQLHAWMTINANKMYWDLSENCQKYALEVSSSACVWHALVDQTLHGQWTNLHEQSPNGPDLVTNTLGSCDFLFTSHKWIWAILSCGKHCTTMQTGTVTGLWFCRRSGRLKIDLRRNVVHIWKPRVCSHKLDVQNENFSFTQFNGIWNYFSWCRSTHLWNSRSWSLGSGNWSVAFFFQLTYEIQRGSAGKPAAWHTIKKTHKQPS